MRTRPPSRRSCARSPETAGGRDVEERTQEEAKADQVIAELSTLDAGGEEFVAKFADLTKAVSAHAEAEEGEEFRTVVASRSTQERIQLGKESQEPCAPAFAGGGAYGRRRAD